MATATANTARTPVILLTDLGVMAMNEDQFEREKHYTASMEMFRSMLKEHLITEEQFAIIDTKMKKKYQPIFGGLCPEKA
jgi:hypothetical protein